MNNIILNSKREIYYVKSFWENSFKSYRSSDSFHIFLTLDVDM